GRDRVQNRQLVEKSRFQSTRPRGARPWAFWRACRSRGSFNPRARVGRDSGGLKTALYHCFEAAFCEPPSKRDFFWYPKRPKNTQNAHVERVANLPAFWRSLGVRTHWPRARSRFCKSVERWPRRSASLPDRKCA